MQTIYILETTSSCVSEGDLWQEIPGRRSNHREILVGATRVKRPKQLFKDVLKRKPIFVQIVH